MRTEDGYIIQQCLDGKSAMFGFLVDKYKRSVYALAYSEVHNLHDAQDITQEVFIKVFQSLHTLRRWDNFVGWLSRITLNTCKNWIRSASRRPDSEFIEDQEQKELNDPTAESYRTDMMNESVREALDSLPEIYCQILTLRYFGEMSVREMSQFLGLSTSTINRRISEAQARLKEEILTMIGTMREKQELPSSFTFRIVEIVKHIRINPISIKPLPWGLSLTAGVIALVLGIGQHFSWQNTSEFSTGSSISGESKVLEVGEYPVNVFNIANISVISSNYGKGYGLGSEVPSLQNALFMAPQVGDTWTKKADMPTARMELSASAVNGKIYAIGGWRVPPPLSTVEEYDPTADKWTKKADIPTPRIMHAGCTMNGKIYIVGGFLADKMEATSRMDEYDPVRDKWTRKADMPTPREYLSACVVNGRIYAIGGQNGRERQISAVEEYDPTKDEWTWKTNIPTFRPVALSASTVNGKIYVIGGSFWRNQNWVVSPAVEEYDPATNIWTKKADMPTPREALSTCVVSGRIYAIGGQDFDNGKLFPTVEEYDPATDTWTKKADMPTARRYSSTSAINGKIYAIGGDDWKVGALSTVEEYDTGFSGESINFKGKLPTTWGDVRTALNK
jgi:RNA polymerase sigma factor (sigma-70 family)